jgi:26S proteasome regulatory subunit N11
MFGRPAKQIHLDTGETVYISGMALLKMLKHGRQGIPIEVIGLMLGSFVDDYTVQVVDVFATPQSATGTSVEAIDEPFQANMAELLKQVGRKENVVGWYHSHPGYNVFLSDVDLEQQKHWETLNPRCVAVVVDPVKSVRGKVVIGAFRTIPMTNPLKPEKEPRETTSFINSSFPLSNAALRRSLGIHYYQMNIAYRMSKEEEDMLRSLNRPMWSTGFQINSCEEDQRQSLKRIKGMIDCIDSYKKDVIDEEKMEETEYNMRHIGKVDPKEYIRENSENLAAHESSQLFRTNLDATTF